MEQSIFYQLSIVLAIAVGIALLFRVLRQPLIIAYIAAGFIVGPSLFDVIHHREAFESFSQIGIALLLFMVGLGLNVSVIKSTGKPVLLTFLAVTLGVGGASFGISELFGFTIREGIIMAVALLFSSTIIVVKALSDKKEQSRLYGQIVIGILLVEDIIATLALLFVSASATGDSTTLTDIGILLGKGAAIGLGLTVFGAYIMPRFSKLFASSQELLYLFALAWAFGVASISWWAGFSLEVGALFAGVAMASLPYAQEISTRLKPLRDFFIVLFFIGLGEHLGISNIMTALVPALIFSVMILVTKPLLMMTALGLLGYTKQTSFKVGVHLSQISEFSIVLIILAATTGAVSNDLTVIITLTALLTIAISAYLMKYDDRLYHRFEKALSIFERASTKREVKALSHYPLVLMGYQKGGHEFIRTFREMKKRYIVIDYDPAVIENLEHQHINHIYGDATDLELLEELGVPKSELIVSTIPDDATNRILVEYITKHNPEAIFICHASTYEEAEALYDGGAAYVILPHFIGTQQVSSFIRSNGSDKKAFQKYRKNHLAALGSASLSKQVASKPQPRG